MRSRSNASTTGEVRHARARPSSTPRRWRALRSRKPTRWPERRVRTPSDQPPGQRVEPTHGSPDLDRPPCTFCPARLASRSPTWPTSSYHRQRRRFQRPTPALPTSWISTAGPGSRPPRHLGFTDSPSPLSGRREKDSGPDRHGGRHIARPAFPPPRSNHRTPDRHLEPWLSHSFFPPTRTRAPSRHRPPSSHHTGDGPSPRRKGRSRQ